MLKAPQMASASFTRSEGVHWVFIVLAPKKESLGQAGGKGGLAFYAAADASFDIPKYLPNS